MHASIDNVLHRLAHDSARGRLLLFCGAGISKQEPTNLPTVDSLIGGILESVAESVPELWRDILACSYLCHTAPFELFMAVIQQALLFRVFETLEPLTNGEPNTIHYSLARLLSSRKAAHLFTTNFDNMIECALGDELHNVKTYYSWDDCDRFRSQQQSPSLLKIHGSFVDAGGKDIAASTILTTIDAIYRSSKEAHLRKWAEFLNGRSVVFLGYSGRDRIDVIPMLSYANGAHMVWLCHSSDDRFRICTESDPLLSKEVRGLMEGGADIVPIAGRTDQFLEVLGQTCCLEHGGQGDIPPATNDRYKRKPTSFVRAGFMPPVFPKYANLTAGYLFLWAGWAQQAGRAFSRFVETCTDEEPRLFSNAFSAIGQVFDTLGEREDADKMYRLALRGFWGLGDYTSIVRTQCMLAELLVQQERYDEVQQLADDSLFLAQRENDDRGVGLSHFASAYMYERMEEHQSARVRYENAAEVADKAGDFWLEAGSLQGLVRTRRQLNGGYDEDSIGHLLSVLDKIYWIGGGSAPSLKIAKMVDPFAVVHDLAKALVQIRGNNACEFADSNTTVNRCGQREQLLAAIRAGLRQKC